MGKIFLLIVGVLVIGVLVYLYYVGFFTKVTIEEKEMGPFVLVYEEHKGAYKNIGPVMDKVYNDLLADGVETTRGMGIYYSDPKTTPEAELRSVGGSIIEDKDADKLPLLEKKYKMMRLEGKKYLVAEFPYKNSMSILAGVLRVYPQITKYVADHKYQTKEMIEIYDMPNGKIFYLMAL